MIPQMCWIQGAQARARRFSQERMDEDTSRLLLREYHGGARSSKTSWLQEHEGICLKATLHAGSSDITTDIANN